MMPFKLVVLLVGIPLLACLYWFFGVPVPFDDEPPISRIDG
jgi:hypothetical protein